MWSLSLFLFCRLFKSFPSSSGLDIFQSRALRIMRMVRIRLSIAITEQEVISSSLHWVSFMLHTIPAADQAVRKRNIRQESNILT